MQIDHPQSVVQIAAIPLVRDLVEQVPVGRRDETDIDGSRLGFAEADHLALLNDAQELDLHRRRDLPDLIQKERATRGRFEDAETVLHRAREGATRVPEELALEERVRERAAVDRDKRSGAPEATRGAATARVAPSRRRSPR